MLQLLSVSVLGRVTTYGPPFMQQVLDRCHQAVTDIALTAFSMRDFCHCKFRRRTQPIGNSVVLLKWFCASTASWNCRLYQEEPPSTVSSTDRQPRLSQWQRGRCLEISQTISVCKLKRFSFCAIYVLWIYWNRFILSCQMTDIYRLNVPLISRLYNIVYTFSTQKTTYVYNVDNDVIFQVVQLVVMPTIARYWRVDGLRRACRRWNVLVFVRFTSVTRLPVLGSLSRSSTRKFRTIDNLSSSVGPALAQALIGQSNATSLHSITFI
jgi:hypothetical protein